MLLCSGQMFQPLCSLYLSARLLVWHVLSIFFAVFRPCFSPALTSNISLVNRFSFILCTCPSKLSCLCFVTFSIGNIFAFSTATLSLLVIPFIPPRNLTTIDLTLLLFLSLSVHDSLPYITDSLRTFWYTFVLISLGISFFPRR